MKGRREEKKGRRLEKDRGFEKRGECKFHQLRIRMLVYFENKVVNS
jgi:hypothetical protein